MASEALGDDVAQSLKTRVADIRAASSIRELVVGDPATTEIPTPSVAIRLAAGYLLLCRPNHATLRRGEDGNVMWERVRRLQVIDIRR